MKRFNYYRMRLILFGFVAGIVFIGGRAKADFTFGEPTNLGPPVNSSVGECPNFITADGLTMYLDSLDRPGGYGGWDIWIATRETTTDEWGAPVNVGASVNSSRHEFCACLSADGLELYFSATNWPGGYGSDDIWMTTKQTSERIPEGYWSTPINLGSTVNSSSYDFGPRISSDGLELYFNSRRGGGHGDDDIWVTRRPTKDDPWEDPVNLGAVVNSSASECFPFLSSDGLALFFSEEKARTIRAGGIGNVDIWVTIRASVFSPWGAPVNLGSIVNSPQLDCGPVISSDGSTIYFCSERPGGLGGPYGDAYQAPIIPIVDFNGDGIVDAGDMCIMVDHWGEDYSLCDIGPMPWGDGIVDVQDLIVLAEHAYGYQRPIAHWTLNEREGNTAYDKVGENNASVYGGALWQPTGGMFGGALEFDGIDDYASTDFVLNPADGEFSVFAWIKGGAPGQVILSQIGGVNWLSVDPSEGNLMTELVPPIIRTPSPPLVSEIQITDGNWHHIGFVWSGAHRTLYVDGIVAAEDVQSNLASSANGLYIGMGKGTEIGTFWSGLIDDVRIYNKALSPAEIAALSQ